MSRLRSRAAWRALQKHDEEVRDPLIAGELMSETELGLTHDSSATTLIRRHRRARNGREG
jgi:hypothetical protein